MATTCSSCSKALADNEVLYTPDARAICASCHAKADLAATRNRTSTSLGIVGVGLVAGVLPLLFSMSETEIVNQDVAYRDWPAIGGGVVAIVCGGIALVMGLKAKAPTQKLTFAALVLGLGAFQIARGVGAFEEKPPYSRAVININEIEKPAPAVDDPEQSCMELKQQHACYEAAMAHARAKRLDKALPLWLESCALGNRDGCTEAGVVYLKGEGAPQDLEKGRTLTAKGCDRGSKVACRNYAILYANGTGVAVDDETAYEFFARACEGEGSYDSEMAGDIAQACTIAGERARQGMGTKASPERALHFYEAACEIVATACFELGVAAQDGIGMKKDPKLARKVYAKACDASEPRSCNNLGNLLNNGVGGAKDREGARPLFQKACDGGLQLGCQNLE